MAVRTIRRGRPPTRWWEKRSQLRPLRRRCIATTRQGRNQAVKRRAVPTELQSDCYGVALSWIKGLSGTGAGEINRDSLFPVDVPASNWQARIQHPSYAVPGTGKGVGCRTAAYPVLPNTPEVKSALRYASA